MVYTIQSNARLLGFAPVARHHEIWSLPNTLFNATLRTCRQDGKSCPQPTPGQCKSIRNDSETLSVETVWLIGRGEEPDEKKFTPTPLRTVSPPPNFDSPGLTRK